MTSGRQLGFIDLFCVASGAMISSGLFVLPGLAYAHIGPSACLAYLGASLLIIPAMLSQSELATAMPKAGGTYFYVDRSMGPVFGTLAGLSSWFSLSFKSAFALLGIGEFAVLIYSDLTPLQAKLIAAAFCVIFCIVNYLGAQHAGRMQVYLVVVLLALLLLYIGVGVSQIDVHNLSPFFTGSSSDFFKTVALIFIAYGGLTKIASVAGEAKNPARTIPISMIASFIVVSIIYFLVVFVTVGVMGGEMIVDGSPSLTPISDGARTMMGTPGLVLLSIAAILAFVSTGNAGILTASRAPLAMSLDDLLPGFFARIHPKRGTPHIAIIATTVLMVAAILILDLEMLVKTASAVMILLFASVNLAVILMRESGIQNYRPKFRSPGYPWVQIAGLIFYGVMLAFIGRGPLLLTAFFLIVSVFWYWFHGRIYANRVSALVHLVRRLTAREIRYDVLNSELKDILLERDEIVEDRFDLLVREAPILDLSGSLGMDGLFGSLSEALASRLVMDAGKVKELLIARESDTSTVLAPGLAIPHIIVPGEHQFELVLIRSAGGASFPGSEEPVHALFALAGTADERNFHLKALMSIAQIVQQRDFMTKWLAASGKEELRDLVLLSERHRHL